MDLGQITIGATVYLPVRVDGALLHLGDVHAVQGDGELSGAAVEMPARTQLKIDVIRNKAIEWPRVEDDSTLMRSPQPRLGEVWRMPFAWRS